MTSIKISGSTTGKFENQGQLNNDKEKESMKNSIDTMARDIVTLDDKANRLDHIYGKDYNFRKPGSVLINDGKPSLEVQEKEKDKATVDKKTNDNVTVHEEIQGNNKDKVIVDVKFGKGILEIQLGRSKDKVFLMGKHLKFIKNIDNAAGFAALAAGAAIVAAPILLGLGTVVQSIGGIIGAGGGTFASWHGLGTSSSMLCCHNDRDYFSHHGVIRAGYALSGAGLGVAAGGLGGMVLGGIGGFVLGLIVAS